MIPAEPVRLRLRVADTLDRLVFFPLANLGDVADHAGARVREWAERQGKPERRDGYCWQQNPERLSSWCHELAGHDGEHRDYEVTW